MHIELTSYENIYYDHLETKTMFTTGFGDHSHRRLGCPLIRHL